MVAIPGFHTVPEYYIHRVILSCDPCLYPYSYVVAAMYNSAPVVAFIKSGELSWTYVYNKFRPVNDILFHKEQLYAVNSRNQVLVIDYEGNDSSDDSEDEDEDEDDDEVEYYEGPCVEYLISEPTEYSHVSYLVESLDGGLLLIPRLYLEIIDDINYKVTVGFKVYRMTRKHSSDEEEEPEWVEIKSCLILHYLWGTSILFASQHLVSATASQIVYTSQMTAQRGIPMLLMKLLTWESFI